MTRKDPVLPDLLQPGLKLVFCGTPQFASPEQFENCTVDIRSDIYSLGVTLWFMLTGKPTFMGSVASVIAQHLDKPPAFESLAVLPTCVVDVLRKMLPMRQIEASVNLSSDRCIVDGDQVMAILGTYLD